MNRQTESRVAALGCLRNAPRVKRASGLDDETIPFAEVFQAILAESRSHLRERSSAPATVLSPEVYASLERGLLHTLSAVCGQVFELAFSLHRFHDDPFPQTREQGAPRRQNKLQYTKFVRDLLNGGLSRVFLDYPALENLTAICAEQWASAAAELLERLQLDRAAIAASFAGGEDPGEVIRIETDLSDRHDGGRTVAALDFASGLRLIYKPKDLGSEEAYFSILDWFNHHGAPLDFHVVRVLKRDNYGWVEFVEQRPCQGAIAAQQYFQRAGQLLCMMYLLGGADCHFDNIVAHGEHPVLIDTEMLFQAKLASDSSARAQSVLRTGLLPQPTSKAEACDFSGFGCVSDQAIWLRVPQWRYPNTDAMALSFRKAILQPHTNVPALEHTTLSPVDYVESVVEGFRQMYRCVQANRRQLRAPASPLAQIATQRVRLLARGTLEYYLVLARMLHPKRLRAVHPQVVFGKPSRFPLLEPLEIGALGQMDVPRFTVEASAKYLALPDGARASPLFAQSGMERVNAQIDGLSEVQMQEQVKVIEFALAFAGMSRISSA